MENQDSDDLFGVKNAFFGCPPKIRKLENPEGLERHLDAARQKLPRDNFCRLIAAQLPSPRRNFGRRKKPKKDFFGLPCKQKITVNKFWVQESEIGEECRQFWTLISGVNFWGGLKPWKNSPSKFAEKFAGNFPKIRQTEINNSPQIRSA